MGGHIRVLRRIGGRGCRRGPVGARPRITGTNKCDRPTPGTTVSKPLNTMRRITEMGTVTFEASDDADAERVGEHLLNSESSTITWGDPDVPQSLIIEVVPADGVADVRYARCRACREPLAGCNCGTIEDWPDCWTLCEMCEQAYRNDEHDEDDSCPACRVRQDSASASA